MFADLLTFFQGVVHIVLNSPWQTAGWFGLLLFGTTWTTKTAGVSAYAAADINLLQDEKADCDGGVPFDNTGLHILDTDASHDLIIAPGSDLTADRTLTITTGDAARTLTMTGNITGNQDVSTTASPTFDAETITKGVGVGETYGLTSKTGLTILDDAVYSFTPIHTHGFILVLSATTTGDSAVISCGTQAGGAMCSALAVGANVNVTTGALAGTTGSDAKITVSTHTDGKVYIENRRGATRYFGFTILAGYGS